MSTNINHSRISNAFFSDVRRYPTMTPDEEAEAFRLFHAGDESQKERIIGANIRFLVSVAKMYGNTSNFLDCINEGFIELNDAINDFDETKGYKFISFAVYRMKNGIRRAAYDATVSSSVQKNMITVINKIRDNFFQTEERYPSEYELSELMSGLGYNNSQCSLNVCTNINVKNISDASGEDGTYEESEEWNTASATTPEAYEEAEKDDMKHRIEKLLSILNNRDREIIRLRYLEGGVIDYDDVARKIEERGYGAICGERCRQIEVAALKKMRKFARA